MQDAKERISKARNKRLLHSKLGGQTLGDLDVEGGEEEELGGAAGWVQRSRKKAEEREKEKDREKEEKKEEGGEAQQYHTQHQEAPAPLYDVSASGVACIYLLYNAPFSSASFNLRRASTRAVWSSPSHQKQILHTSLYPA